MDLFLGGGYVVRKSAPGISLLTITHTMLYKMQSKLSSTVMNIHPFGFNRSPLVSLPRTRAHALKGLPP